MKIFNLIAPIHQRDPLLFRSGLYLLILSVLLCIPMMMDSREVMGINPWLKPIKFSLSITIFVWTMAWFLADLPHGLYKWKRALSWTFFITMLVEIGIIIFQAGRGTTSHYNISSPLNGILFGFMGLMIAVSTVAVAIILLFYIFTRPKVDYVYLTSVRISLVIFLIASAVGGIMIGNEAHSIGVDDGGPGIPFFNWSTEGGDLRLAHFLGLHTIQILPLFAWASMKYFKLNTRTRMILLLLFTLVFSSIWSYIMLNSMKGVSITDML